MIDPRRRLLDDEDVAWRALSDAFERVGEDRFEEPSLTPEGWSPKDAMFHVGAWMADCATQLDRMAAGTFDADEETRETIERRNEEWFQVSRTMRAEDVRAGFAASRLRMVSAFGSLDEITPDAVEWFEESGALHYAKHREDLRAFVEEATA